MVELETLPKHLELVKGYHLETYYYEIGAYVSGYQHGVKNLYTCDPQIAADWVKGEPGWDDRKMRPNRATEALLYKDIETGDLYYINDFRKNFIKVRNETMK